VPSDAPTTATPSPAPTVGSISPTPSPTASAPAPSTTTSTTPAPTSSATAPTGNWPSASSTGFQHTGVSLSPFACTGSVTEISTPGTVIDSKAIGCGILINADNVTISRSRVTSGADIAIRTADGRRGATISDTEIVGQPGCIAGIGYEGWTALRVNIHGCGDGVRIETGSTLQDSWIHDFWDGMKNGVRIDTPRNDGAQSTGGSNMTIRHNRIDNPHNQTSCLLIGGEFGSPSNVLIESNYFNGGNFSIYLDPKGSNRVIRNNILSRNYVYGPTVLDGQYVWENNSYEDGTPLVR
jgi:Right handed beta helix region